jgi:hypothetical protein
MKNLPSKQRGTKLLRKVLNRVLNEALSRVVRKASWKPRSRW